MPSPDNPRLLIFGDSHIASARRAVDRGLVDLSGYELEFWGAYGPAFREFRLRSGVVHAMNETKEIALKINGQGRTTVSPAEFDVVLFYGARLRAAHFFAPYLHRLQCGIDLPSRAVMTLATRHFLRSLRSYRLAAALARAKETSVLFAQAAFPTAGIRPLQDMDPIYSENVKAFEATAADRDLVWGHLHQTALQDGVALVRQPEHTITDGIFTHEEFAVSDAHKKLDDGHKSDEFAALMIREALGLSDDHRTAIPA